MNADAEAAPFVIGPDFQVHSSLPSLKRYVEFYNCHPVLQLPHQNPLAKQQLTRVTISCDGCNEPVPDTLVRGVINDYAGHTEVRFVAPCRKCARLLHNTLRFTTDGELVFMSDGAWFRTKPPLWKILLYRIPILRPFL